MALQNFNLQGKSFPPAEEAERINEYQTNRRLYDGNLVAEVPALRIDDETVADRINWFASISEFWQDLVSGEPPLISVKNPAVNSIVQSLDWEGILPPMIIDYCRFGDAVVRVNQDDNGNYIIENIDPAVWYPILDSSQLDKPVGILLAWGYRDGEASDQSLVSAPEGQISVLPQAGYQNNKLRVLEYNLQTGKYTERNFTLNNNVIGEPVSSNDFDLNVLPIVHVGNGVTADRYYGQSMYKNIKDLVAAYNTRYTAMKNIMEAHSSPNLYGPEESVVRADDGEFQVDVGNQFFPVPVASNIAPGYLTWDGKLDSNFEFLKQTEIKILTAVGISPSSFSSATQSSNATSAGALRRWNLRQVAKQNRMQSDLAEGIRGIINVIAANQGVAMDNKEINISWQDFINDEIEDEKTIRMYEAGIIDNKTALARIDNVSPDEIEGEARYSFDNQQNDAFAAREGEGNGNK